MFSEEIEDNKAEPTEVEVVDYYTNMVNAMELIFLKADSGFKAAKDSQTKNLLLLIRRAADEALRHSK